MEGLSDAANLALAHLTLGQVLGNLGEHNDAIAGAVAKVVGI
jgi:hypothetical protein